MVLEPYAEYINFISKSLWFRDQFGYFWNILNLLGISSNFRSTNCNLPIYFFIVGCQFMRRVFFSLKKIIIRVYLRRKLWQLYKIYCKLQSILLKFGVAWILHFEFWKFWFYTLKFDSVSKNTPSINFGC